MKELIDMLDYRLHYAIQAAEERVRPSREHSGISNRGVKRLFRLSAERPTGRSAERR